MQMRCTSLKGAPFSMFMDITQREFAQDHIQFINGYCDRYGKIHMHENTCRRLNYCPAGPVYRRETWNIIMTTDGPAATLRQLYVFLCISAGILTNVLEVIIKRRRPPRNVYFSAIINSMLRVKHLPFDANHIYGTASKLWKCAYFRYSSLFRAAMQVAGRSEVSK